MGVRFPSVASNSLLFTTTGSTAEISGVTTPPLAPSLAGALILIYWYCCIGSGTGMTSCSIRIRRGNGLGGTIVNPNPNPDQTIAAPVANMYRGGCLIDSPGEIGTIQYTLTFQANGLTGTFFLNEATLVAMVL